MIAAPIAKLRRTLGRFAKRTVKGRGEFCRVTHDARLVVAGRVERLANRADPAVHHIARRDDVGSGGGVGKRAFHEQLDALVVQDVEMVAVDPSYAAVAVAHVFAQADIGDDEELGTFGLDCADRMLHDAIFGVSAGGGFILFVRDAEKKDGLQAGGLGAGGLRCDLAWRELIDPGHAADRAAGADFLVHEKRKDEIVRAEIGLAHEVAQGRGAPQTARAMNQFPHPARLRVTGLGAQAFERNANPVSRASAVSIPSSALPPPRDDKCVAAVFVALVMPRPAPNKKSNYLLIDVSNSFTKLAFASKDRLGATERIETARLSEAAIASFLRRRIIELVVVCSVVPKKNALIRRAAGKTRVFFVSAKCTLGVGVDYPEPESIGADRLANAAAVAALYGTPAVVVDFGTAVTFDVVSAERSYIGGVIAPGLEAMTTYLYKRTALLPKLTLTEPRRAVGRSTKAAMMSGAIFGYRGLVKEILAKISAESFDRRRAQVVATGGYAHLIAARLPEIDAVRPHLTLEGLRIIGNLNR